MRGETITVPRRMRSEPVIAKKNRLLCGKTCVTVEALGPFMRIQEMRSGLVHLRKRMDAVPVDRILEMRMMLEPELLAVAERFEREIPKVAESLAVAGESEVVDVAEVKQPEAAVAEADAGSSELGEPCWAVVSFERVEVSRLTYAQAVVVMDELADQGVAGLCIITNDAAGRITQA